MRGVGWLSRRFVRRDCLAKVDSDTCSDMEVQGRTI